MIFEFPDGHAYDYQRLCAGVTAVIGRSPSVDDGKSSGWARDKARPMPNIKTPIQTITAMYSAVTISASSNLPFTVFQVQVCQEQGHVSVSIADGCMDPIHEVVGRWRYGQQETFELP